ncbi:hypothetical protein E2320_020363 [Naja naja]|nr:hypothetical protein E2320_020363 [Naja naja]
MMDSLSDITEQNINLKGLDGAETKANNKARIKKSRQILQERMEIIRNQICLESFLQHYCGFYILVLNCELAPVCVCIHKLLQRE